MSKILGIFKFLKNCTLKENDNFFPISEFFDAFLAVNGPKTQLEIRDGDEFDQQQKVPNCKQLVVANGTEEIGKVVQQLTVVEQKPKGNE